MIEAEGNPRTWIAFRLHILTNQTKKGVTLLIEEVTSHLPISFYQKAANVYVFSI